MTTWRSNFSNLKKHFPSHSFTWGNHGFLRCDFVTKTTRVIVQLSPSTDMTQNRSGSLEPNFFTGKEQYILEGHPHPTAHVYMLHTDYTCIEHLNLFHNWQPCIFTAITLSWYIIHGSLSPCSITLIRCQPQCGNSKKLNHHLWVVMKDIIVLANKLEPETKCIHWFFFKSIYQYEWANGASKQQSASSGHIPMPRASSL